MKCAALLVMILAAATSLAGAQPAVRPEGEAWAVIIGVNRYQNTRIPRLRYAVNDARSVERVLIAQGFSSHRIMALVEEEATKARIETVLGDELRQRVGRDDRVLVFFAGHGMTDRLRSGEEEGYLLPVDGDPERLFGTAISMSALRRISDRLPAKHILYIVDACYSGYAFYNRSVSTTLVDEMLKRPAIQILTAGRQGDQAQEKEGHGVFTDVLLRGIQGDAFGDKSWLALEELGLWMKQRVFAESNRKQLPQYGNLSGEGQFVFFRAAMGTAQPGLEDLRAMLLGRWEGQVLRPAPGYRTLIVDRLDSREGRFVASVRWNQHTVKDVEVELLPSGRPMIQFSPPGGASIRLTFDGTSAQGTLKVGDSQDWVVQLKRGDSGLK